MLKNKVFHLGLTSLDIGNSILAILPGDPKRADKIANMMINPVHLFTNREFVVWKAQIDNNCDVIICSTGIGGPSVSIVVEELSQLGIRIFLRVGTTGAIQHYINIGDLLIVNAAVRLDGASQHFAPLEFPAVADFSCTTALVEASKKIGVNFYVGVSVSSDTFYPGQERYDTYSRYIINKFRGSMKEWQNMGVMGYEMESSTLLTMCMVQGLRAGVITGVIGNRVHDELFDNISSMSVIVQNIERNLISVTLEASRTLLK